MSKFDKQKANVQAPVKTTGRRRHTAEGHLGFERDAKSELFLLAVSNMVSEQTFYETAGDRDQRFKDLIHAVTAEDPAWVRGLIPYLRNVMQMRSASIVMAAEYVAAGGKNGRTIVHGALSRADEPAEMLAYWAKEYGRNFPKPVKRGVADAASQLYTEYNALKYDGQSRSWRMGDVIDVTHPKPRGEWQAELFRWLLDTRHNREDVKLPEGCDVIAYRHELESLPVEERREALIYARLGDAGMTWESLSGWLQGPMDAAAWESVIPSMGYMALIRNLRNFEEAGVAGDILDNVAVRISDPDEVAKSRQFPLRFLSAYKHIPSERFAFPLSEALDCSVQNIPTLAGRTLILIDVSGSMHDRLSGRSTLQRWEAAALFGVALAKRNPGSQAVIYQSFALEIPTNLSVLRTITNIQRHVGGGTQTMQTLRQFYAGHDRVVILTDEQAHPGGIPEIPAPIYTFNLGGYRTAHLQQGEKGSYAFGGLTDAGFTMLKTLDEMKSGSWPFSA